MKILFKRIYAFLPFKKQVFSLLKHFWKPKSSIYKHLHFKGIITVPINFDRSFKMMHYGFQVENDIFWSGLTGEWEKVSLDLWIKICESADVIFDIGSNTGVYSLVAKTVNQNATVYALEPVKRVFDKLKVNNQLNGFNIKCMPVAASNYVGKAKIYDTDSEHTYSVTVNENLNPDTDGIIVSEIDATTLDVIIIQEMITKIDLMKIDVETHEAEVLEGFSNHIKLFRPTILIEILNDEVGFKVQKIVEGLGYLYFNINEKYGAKLVKEITKSTDLNYLLCNKSVAEKLKLT